MPAISEGYSRRVQEKKENCINIYMYVKRTILEAIQFVLLAEVIDFAYAQNFLYHVMKSDKQSESVS